MIIFVRCIFGGSVVPIRPVGWSQTGGGLFKRTSQTDEPLHPLPPTTTPCRLLSLAAACTYAHSARPRVQIKQPRYIASTPSLRRGLGAEVTRAKLAIIRSRRMFNSARMIKTWAGTTEEASLQSLTDLREVQAEGGRWGGWGG